MLPVVVYGLDERAKAFQVLSGRRRVQQVNLRGFSAVLHPLRCDIPPGVVRLHQLVCIRDGVEAWCEEAPLSEPNSG